MEFSVSVLSYLASVTVRSLGLAALALVAVFVLRLKSAAARHALCTVVVAGMLALAALTPLLPSLTVRVLPGEPQAAALPTPAPLEVSTNHEIVVRPVSPARQWPAWQQFAMAIYAAVTLAFLLRLAFGYLFTRRLVQSGRPIDHPWAKETYESNWISVPMTVGYLRPRILLPQGWDQWEDAKLQAVLAHERTHVERADWAISVMAGVNRSLFWFHPLAWWLERKLAFLAEQACDDAALQLVGTEPYAQALLDMAAAVKTGQGRLIWEAMAMANISEVRQRIERILDETRQVPKALTRQRWLALVACSLPLIYVASVVDLAPAQTATPPAIAELTKGGRQLTAADAAQMEQYLAGNPQDLDVRSQLVLYYFFNGTREQRLNHIFWMILNHPESKQAGFTSRGLTPRTTTFNDAVDYARAANLWKQQAASHADNPQVLANAAEFLSQPGGDFTEAERLLQAGRKLEPNALTWVNTLSRLYAVAIVGSAGDPSYPNVDPAFAAHAKSEMEASTDGRILSTTGRVLSAVAQRPQPGSQLPAGILNLDEHPALEPVVTMGRRFVERAAQYGGGGVGYGVGALQMARDRQLAVAGIVGSVPSANPSTGPAGAVFTPLSTPPGAPPPPPAPLSAVPTLVHRVDPVYPELARTARINGDVKLKVSIATDGHVQYAQVISGHPLMVPPALDAIKQWVYAPIPAPGDITVTIPFRLDGSNTPLEQLVPQAIKDAVADQAAGPQRIKIGASVQVSKVLFHPDPVYPDAARAAGVEGSVTLNVLIADDGKVLTADAVDGNPILAAAAAAAVRQWTYQPTRLNGNPIQVLTQVTVPFTLH